MQNHKDNPTPKMMHTNKGSYRIPKEAVKSDKETHAAFIHRVGVLAK